MVSHGEETHIDLSLLAAPDPIHRCLRSAWPRTDGDSCLAIVDATFRHTAEYTKAMPMGIEHRGHRGAIGPSPMAEVVGLKQICPHEERPAVRQLDMRNLQLRALTAKNRVIFAPVELEGFTRSEGQWHETAAPRRLLFTLAVCPPRTGEGRNSAIRTGEAKSHETA